MLSGKLPTGTVGGSGAADRPRNVSHDQGRTDDRRSGAGRTRPAAAPAAVEPPFPNAAGTTGQRVAALESEIQSLETELARCGEEKREIIDRYEALLAARDARRVPSKTDANRDERETETASTALLRRLSGLLR